ncbi:hypothetical protein [Myxococcus vastator]|nr:hypothetical protein [Myxococcus vastator]
MSIGARTRLAEVKEEYRRAAEEAALTALGAREALVLVEASGAKVSC